MQDLGLAQFVFKGNQRCSSSKYPFIGATDNWKNGKADLLKDCCSKMELLLAKYIHFKKKKHIVKMAYVWHIMRKKFLLRFFSDIEICVICIVYIRLFAHVILNFLLIFKINWNRDVQMFPFTFSLCIFAKYRKIFYVGFWSWDWFYISLYDLFITDCNETLLEPLPSLSGKPVTCHFLSSCSGIHCCVDVPAISSTFSTKLEIDPCTFQMVVSIDQLSFSKNLFEYEWGQEEEVWLFGVVRMT